MDDDDVMLTAGANGRDTIPDLLSAGFDDEDDRPTLTSMPRLSFDADWSAGDADI